MTVAHIARARAVAEPTVSDEHQIWLDLAADLRGVVGPSIGGADAGDGGLADAVRVDRLALNWASPFGDLTVGRQAWGHGTARVFPVTDVVRPFSPASVDTEFKQGVELARWSRPFGESFELEALGVHDASLSESETGWGGLGRARIIVPTADVSILGGALQDEPLAGLAAAGDLLGAGWYAEALWRDGDTASTVGASWMSPWRVSLTAETLYNRGAYPLLPGRWWGAGLAAAELTPLVTADLGALIPLSQTDLPPGVEHLIFGGATANVSDDSTVRLGWVDKAFYADVRSAF